MHIEQHIHNKIHFFLEILKKYGEKVLKKI